MKVNTAIYLDTRRIRQDETYPVKIRITYQRKRKYYPTKYTLSEEDFEKVISPKPRGNFKDLKLELIEVEKKAISIIDSLPAFSFEAFEKKYLDTRAKGTDVYSLFENYIAELQKQKRASTAISYGNALNSIRQFAGKHKLPFERVSPDWLHNYEQYMLGQGKSLTTVGIYLRGLRIIMNLAIEDGLISKELYPFGKRRYQIPAGRNVKKALTLDDMQKIFDYEPQTESQAKSKDLFLFSYLCNGINIKDIARLRYRNIDDDKISFIRAKTERTSKENQKPVVAMLTPEAKEIIERWGNKPADPNKLIFDIFSDGLTPEQEVNKVKSVVKTINTHLKKIAQSVGIEKNISTYTARHSFSTILKRSGAPVEFISESLGHHDLRTTESYLDSFEDDMKKKYAGVLTRFNTKNDN